ncbi:MAG TPA: vitamin K epoxide reductase family protein [Methylomirabilota bacterium]|nr:vitamin K epoxide reductase family protein [Methylomirabilota bacterium]
MATRRRDVAVAAPARPDYLVAGLAAAGFAIAVYLTWLKWTGGNTTFCLSGSGCDIVQASRYGTLLGLPTALWGALLYAAIGALAGIGLTASRWNWAFWLAAAGVGVSVYLTALSLLVIHATCAYCLASGAIMLAILLVLWWRRSGLPGRRTKLSSVIGYAVALALLAPFGAAFIFAMPEGGSAAFEAALARHLRDKGAVMYGAYWCPHCTEQKALFGDAAKDLPYVECDPKGVNPRPDLCEKARVKSFPTWVFGDKRREGVMTPQALAEFSDFKESPRSAK